MKFFIPYTVVLFFFFVVSSCTAQPFQNKKTYSHDDSLRGSLTPGRTWWDVVHYDIAVKPDYNTKTIQGTVKMKFKVLRQGNLMQIDFQQPMQINNIVWNEKSLPFKRDSNVVWLNFNDKFSIGQVYSISMEFSGKPREAMRPPWDGGWIWKKDKNGNPWITVACQGLGASVWYPCKDYQGDEPDSAVLHITVPDTLVAVGNGRLRNTITTADHFSTYTWAVVNPINNYNIIPYIGKYVNFKEVYPGRLGNLDVNYWVIDYNIDTAKAHMRGDVHDMLACFEDWFGPYPFYEDGYKLVEAPHLGMEHQSAIAYGNKFKMGYSGKDLSETGWGLKWDFIIVHESGHEWFGNNITTNDVADMWVHEGFTNYSETLFTGYKFGKEAGNDYLVGIRKLIQNDIPIIGVYNVNQEGSGDMYYKAGNMIHIIRQVINDDEKFKNILRGLNKTFYHKTVTTQQIEKYISLESGINFSKLFDQYLRTVKIPVLEYKVQSSQISYRWTNCVKGFNLPIKITNGNERWIKPTEKWQSFKSTSTEFKVDRNFYVEVRKI